MGLEPLLKDPEVTADQQLMKNIFFEHTGYGSEDLLAFNYATRVFFTKNGGKYRVEAQGIEHLSGPPPDVADRYLD